MKKASKLFLFFISITFSFISLVSGISMATISPLETLITNATPPNLSLEDNPVLELSFDNNDANIEEWNSFLDYYSSESRFYRKSIVFSTSKVKLDPGTGNPMDSLIIDFSLLGEGNPDNCSDLLKIDHPSTGNYLEIFGKETNAIPILISNTKAMSLFGVSSPADAIGKEFEMCQPATNAVVQAIVGATYDGGRVSNVFKNTFFFSNFEDPLFFSRSASTKQWNTQRHFLTLSGKPETNKSILIEITRLKLSMSGFSISIPNLPANECKTGEYSFVALANRISNQSKTFKGFSAIPIVVGLTLIFVSLFANKGGSHAHKSVLSLVSLLGISVVGFLIKSIPFGGVSFAIFSSSAGWSIIVIGFLLTCWLFCEIVLATKPERRKTRLMQEYLIIRL